MGDGAPERENITQDTPVSVSGGGNAIGYAGTFSATATKVGGGYAAAYGNEGIDSPDTYNRLGGTGVDGDAIATVQYTIRVVARRPGLLFLSMSRCPPMRVRSMSPGLWTAITHPFLPALARKSLSITRKVTRLSGILNFPMSRHIKFMTNRYFTSGAGYAAPDLLGNGDSFDGIVMIEANFDVAVDVVAEASAQFKSLAAAYSESAGGSAYADPTFAIDDPAFADYTIVGVPVGPAAATAPEPADLGARLRGTWLRGAPQGEEQRPFGPITKAGHLRLPASAIAENVEHERPAINV